MMKPTLEVERAAQELEAVTMARLTCISCGADLGDAEDPYRDPDCLDCLHRQLREEAEQEANEAALADYRELVLGEPAARPLDFTHPMNRLPYNAK